MRNTHDICNKFTLKANEDYFNIGTNAGLPKHYGYSVSGIKRDVVVENWLTMNYVNRDFSGISKLIFPLQFWRPSKNSSDDLQKKLLLLKTN